jgi:CBS domain-containing protein
MVPLEDVPVLREDEEAIEALAELSEANVHRAVVLDGDRLAGLVSITDLARALEVGMPRQRRAA